jgi:hypothetical protein
MQINLLNEIFFIDFILLVFNLNILLLHFYIYRHCT